MKQISPTREQSGYGGDVAMLGAGRQDGWKGGVGGRQSGRVIGWQLGILVVFAPSVSLPQSAPI